MNELKNLCLINGASGDESRVRAYIRDYIKSRVTPDELYTDNLGNLIVFKKGRKRPKNKIMFSAHMD